MTDNNEPQGWVKNYRKLCDWEWYTTPFMAHLWQHIIRQAAHRNYRWRGMIVKRGQLITSQRKLSEETGLSRGAVRRCLAHLSAQEIVLGTAHQYTLITIVNYRAYQYGPGKSGPPKKENPAHLSAHERPTSGPPFKYKNDKNVKNKRHSDTVTVTGENDGRTTESTQQKAESQAERQREAKSQARPKRRAVGGSYTVHVDL